jgi:hypothetical protein
VEKRLIGLSSVVSATGTLVTRRTCIAVFGAPTTCKIGSRSAKEPAIPLEARQNPFLALPSDTGTHHRAESSPTPNVVISTASVPLTRA